MANMMDYLKWRGDLTFEQSGFNEVDNLILAELVYVHFKDIAPRVGQEAITLEEANRLFFERYTDEDIEKSVSSTKAAAYVMREMAKTQRFRTILLKNYVEDISETEESQFCALTIEYTKGESYISYSGTDTTIVGWKENFNMSFLSETPGQLKAVQYLEGCAAENQNKLYVGGHSKGGNLAVYAAVHCDQEVQDRILKVYSNDGPGFTEKMMEREAYQRMVPRICTIVPQSSIVGMLFEHEEDFEIVESSQNGPMQHDAMSWEVLGTSLVREDKMTYESVLLDKTLKSWIAKLDYEHRVEFVDTLFMIFEKAHITTLDDLATFKWKDYTELLKTANTLDKENQEILRKTVRLLWEESNRTIKHILMKPIERKQI